ncbi:MAG: phosphoribosyl-ATP diphosphatase [Eubacterium sp.]
MDSIKDSIKNDYETILARRDAKEDGSYTCYLFEQGIDKILKKVGEESTEMVIAAKNGVKDETVGEICDLIYHTLVMMVDRGITLEDVKEVLDKRAEKAGNLKKFHVVDKNS